MFHPFVIKEMQYLEWSILDSHPGYLLELIMFAIERNVGTFSFPNYFHFWDVVRLYLAISFHSGTC